MASDLKSVFIPVRTVLTLLEPRPLVFLKTLKYQSQHLKGFLVKQSPFQVRHDETEDEVIPPVAYLPTVGDVVVLQLLSYVI